MGMASELVGGGQKRCELQWKFVVAGLGCHNGLLRYVDFPEVGLGSKPKPLCLGIARIDTDFLYFCFPIYKIYCHLHLFFV